MFELRFSLFLERLVLNVHFLFPAQIFKQETSCWWLWSDQAEPGHLLSLDQWVAFLSTWWSLFRNLQHKILNLREAEMFKLRFCNLELTASACLSSAGLLSVSGVLHGQNAAEHHDQPGPAERLWWGHLPGNSTPVTSSQFDPQCVCSSRGEDGGFEDLNSWNVEHVKVSWRNCWNIKWVGTIQSTFVFLQFFKLRCFNRPSTF